MFLENVKHILKVDNGNVFKTILKKLREIDYVVSCQTLSPHQLGIPQQRERVIFTCIKKDIYESNYKPKTDIFIHNETPHNTDIIVQDKKKDTKETKKKGKKKSKSTETKPETKPKEEKFDIKLYNDFNFELGIPTKPTMKEMKDIKDKDVDPKYKMSEELIKVFDAWDEMVKFVDKDQKLSPTILCHEFNTKIYKDIPQETNGNGDGDNEESETVVRELDPEFEKLVKWKQDYIMKNRPLYEHKKYKKKWDKWYKKHSKLLKKKEIYGKLEWQTGPKKVNDSIWNYFIQVRQSGIRVKKTNYFPTLVAIVQTPIYGKEKRYITPRECARLQSFPDEFKLHAKDNVAYKQFGNAVNVDVIRTITNLILQNYT